MIRKEITCNICKKPHTLSLNPKDFQDWVSGKKAQHAFPYLSADERELLISGTCGVCFEKLFEGDEDIEGAF